MDTLTAEGMGLFVVVAHQVDGGMACVEFIAGLHFLGAQEEEVTAVQLKEVGALPHPAVLIAAVVQHRHKVPLEAVGAVVEDHRAALVLGAGHRHGGIGAVRLLPDLGVPEVILAVAFGQILDGQDRVLGDLLVVDPVAHCHALGLDVVIVALGVQILRLAHAGVQQQLPAVGQLGCRAGEASVLVVGHIRGHGCRQVLPAQQVTADGVAPVHGAPHRLVGIVLVEQVVLTLIEGKAIGVVHPADPGGQMVNGTFTGGEGLAILCLIGAGFL